MRKLWGRNEKGFSHHFILPILVFIAVGAIGVYIIAKSSAIASNYNVWQWNVAGYKINKGSATNGMTEVAVRSIFNRKAQLVSFNEMCSSQYNDVKKRLKNGGWPDKATFYAFVTTRSDGCNGKPYGNAIFIKGGVSNIDRYTLQNDGSKEVRAMVCALVSGTKDRFCTTHITTSSEAINGQAINVQQLNRVRSILDGYYRKGERVIIAGDFNSQPNYGRLDSWYAPSLKTPYNSGNKGVYREVDDNDANHCLGYGEWTAGDSSESTPCGTPYKKIDMIFFRGDQVTSYNGDALTIAKTCGAKKNAACSDHRILIGNIVFK
jgi:endonuclease/exonuclease/phosphatase family metal-dependent hydrolase